MHGFIKPLLALVALAYGLANPGLIPLVELHVVLEHRHEHHSESESQHSHQTDHEHLLCELEAMPASPRSNAGDLVTLTCSNLAIEFEPIAGSDFEPEAFSLDPDLFRARNGILRR